MHLSQALGHMPVVTATHSEPNITGRARVRRFFDDRRIGHVGPLNTSRARKRGSRARHNKAESLPTTKCCVWRWRFQTSRHLAQSRGMAGDRRLFNVPLYVYPQLLRAIGRLLWSRLTLPSDEAFNREIVVFNFHGLMQGLYRSR